MMKFIFAVRKKKPKMLFVKKECLACPPNGDGTRVNGEPDRRCKDTKGTGAGKAPKAATKPAKGVSKQPEKSLPNVKDFPAEVLSFAPIEKWSEEQQLFWSNQENIDAVEKKSAELHETAKDLRERIKAYNDKLEKYPSVYNWNYGGFVRDVPPAEREALAAENRAIKADKDIYDKDLALQNKLNSVVSEINRFGGAEAVGMVKEIEAERKAAEAEKIRKAEAEKRKAERQNKQRVKEEKEVEKIGSVAKVNDWQDSSSTIQQAGLEAYNAWKNASQEERRAMNLSPTGAAGGGFKTAWIREDTETEERFIPAKPIIKLDREDQKKFDNLTLESKKSLMAGIRSVPRQGMEGQHIIDVEYKDGSKSTLRIITDAARITTGPGRDKWGLPTDYVDVQYSYIYNWDY